MALNDDKQAIESLRRHLMTIDKCVSDYKRTNGENISEMAFAIITMKAEVEKMAKIIARLEKERQ